MPTITPSRQSSQAHGYDRARDLIRILPMWPHEVADGTLEQLTELVARLRRALRAERQRGIAGHWTYSVSRHTQLANAYRCEAALLAERIAQTDRRDGVRKDRVDAFQPTGAEARGPRAMAGSLPEKVVPRSRIEVCIATSRPPKISGPSPRERAALRKAKRPRLGF